MRGSLLTPKGNLASTFQQDLLAERTGIKSKSRASRSPNLSPCKCVAYFLFGPLSLGRIFHYRSSTRNILLKLNRSKFVACYYGYDDTVNGTNERCPILDTRGLLIPNTDIESDVIGVLYSCVNSAPKPVCLFV